MSVISDTAARGGAGPTSNDAVHLERLLRDWIARHAPSRSGYLSVRRGYGAHAVACDLAVGHGWADRPAAVDDLVPAYCITKPLLPLLLAASAPHLLDGAVDVLPANLQPGGPFLPGVPADAPVVARLPVAGLLTHTVGLCAPASMDWRIYGLTMSDDDIACSIIVGEEPTYSDFAAWALLERYFRAETGRDASDAIHDDLLEPLGLADRIVVDGRRYGPELVERIAVPVQRTPVGRVPMLSERCPSELDLVRPAFGGTVSPRGMADLLHAVGAVLDGHDVDGLPPPHLLEKLLACRGPAVLDPQIGRRLSFAGGFMSNHGADCFPGAGDATIGHLAGLTLAGALHDPDRQLTAAVYLDGVIERPEQLGELQRRAIGDLVAWSDR